MIDTYRTESQQIKQEIASLRRTIIQAEPGVMYDGRFDEMILSPIATVTIARQLLQELIHRRREMAIS